MFARTCLVALSLASTLLLPLQAAAAPRYKVAFLPQRFSPIDINNAGVIAGHNQASETSSYAAILVRGKIIKLGTLGGSQSTAYAINDAGQVTGSSTLSDQVTTHAFLYTRGRMIDIDGRGPGLRSTGLGINAKGQVTGWFVNRQGEQHAFRYAGHGLQDLGTLGGSASLGWDINDAGTVVGESMIAGPEPEFARPWHSFVYRNGPMRDLGVLQTGSYASAAQEINNAGQIAGYSEVDGANHLFFYERGIMTDLGFFGGRWLNVRDMNERGSFVGTADGGPGHVPFLYADGQLYDLNALVTLPRGWRIEGVSGINDYGQIVGAACQFSTCVGVRLDPARHHHHR